ncbi:hypothetical protein [Aestuariivivens sediminicola]|uniref:hypothetical protein n=1 Tax=Aestuariivivens sediminicola TaxID=2913560 RepID=UPI001F5A0300|nr:hypothetical protein [Aestuariivivens sediminicola]
MKYLLVFLFSITLYSQTEMAEVHPPFNFQGLTWDSTKEDVNAKFPESMKIGKYLSVDTNVNYLDASLIFRFEEGNLNLIMYTFKEKHSNENIYIEDFLNLKELLIEKYGEPNLDETEWRRDLYKGDTQYYGLAISMGDLIYKVQWLLPDTDIRLLLYGDNYKVKHTLAYLKNVEGSKRDRSKTLNKL